MMLDPTYAADVLTWMVVWAAAGYTVREYLAGRPSREQRHAERTTRR